MSDGVLAIVALVLVVALPFDIYVANRFIRAASVRPYDDVATGIALTTGCIAIAAAIAALLGIHTIRFQASGGTERLLPMGISVVLIAIAMIVISIPAAYWLAKFRAWRRKPQLHIHRRTDDDPRWHRRFDDPPILAPPADEP